MDITTGLTDRASQAFSWMLIHSLWQGLLLTLIAGIILMLTRKGSAATRYNLILMLFAVFMLTVACTFAYEYNNLLPPAAQYQISNDMQKITGFKQVTLPSSQPVIADNIDWKDLSFVYNIYRIKAFIKTFSNYFSKHSPLIVMLWFIFFIVKLVSLIGGILYMHRAKHYRVYAPSDHWKERIALLCEKLQLKKAVLLLESGYLKTPVVIGYFKPVILVPVGLIAGIPAAQIEAVLLHELAHIRRNDYLINFLQRIAETIFFFNPGLLWISSLIREERENCCDDIAIAQTNNKEEFVQALINFKAYSVSIPAYAVAFSGQKNSLLNRVMRIVYQENKTLSIKENGIFLAGIVMLSLMAFTIYPLQNKETLVAKTVKTYTANFNKQITPLEITDKSDNNYSTVLKPKNTDIHKKKKHIIDSAKVKNVKALNKLKPVNEISGQEMQNLVKKAKFEGDQFYSRIVLDDGVYDMIRILMPSGSKMMATLKHNSKVAFIIDGVMHEENEISNFTQSQINSFDNEKRSIGPVTDDRKSYPSLDPKKYGAFVAIGTDQNSPLITQAANISP